MKSIKVGDYDHPLVVFPMIETRSLADLLFHHQCRVKVLGQF